MLMDLVNCIHDYQERETKEMQNKRRTNYLDKN